MVFVLDSGQAFATCRELLWSADISGTRENDYVKILGHPTEIHKSYQKTKLIDVPNLGNRSTNKISILHSYFIKIRRESDINMLANTARLM